MKYSDGIFDNNGELTLSVVCPHLEFLTRRIFHCRKAYTYSHGQSRDYCPGSVYALTCLPHFFVGILQQLREGLLFIALC